MKPIPIDDASAPIACTISSDEIPQRIALVERMRTSLLSIDRTDHGLLLHFRNEPSIEADLRRFAEDEKRCCQFWGFAIDSAASELALRWDGPPAANSLLDQLHAYFVGDQPRTAITGLL